MKKFFRIVLLAAVLVFVFVTPALALQVEPPEVESPAVEFFVKLLFGLALTLPGANALGVVLVNIGKAVGLVKDNYAAIVLNILNVAFALFIGLASLFTSWNIPGLDVKFNEFANTLTVLLPAFLLIYKWLAPYFYKVFRGFPLIGHSYSPMIEK